MDSQRPENQAATESYILHLLSQTCSESTDPDIIQLLAASATSEIHPVFARERLAGFSDTDFPRLSPALMLASRLLTSPQALHFWHTFIYGPRTMVVDLNGKQQSCFHRVFQDQTQPLPAEEEQRVRQNMRDFAYTLVEISLADLPEDIGGICYPIPDAPISHVLPAVDPTHPGRCSRIMVQKRSCDEINPAKAEPDELLCQWLLLARVLVHEVGHAIAIARNYEQEDEEFYETSPTIEMGHLIEETLFGGLLTWDEELGDEGVLLVLQSTSPGVISAYEDTLAQQSPSPKDAAIMTIAKDDWVAKLFTLPFWESDVVLSNGLALHPPYCPCICPASLECLDETALVLTARQEQLMRHVPALTPEEVMKSGDRDGLRRLRRELGVDMTGCVEV